jgi:uncharacterized protein (DUF1778 family)
VERRNKLLAFRVKPEEERRIRQAADAAGERVSTWLRRTVLRATPGALTRGQQGRRGSSAEPPEAVS